MVEVDDSGSGSVAPTPTTTQYGAATFRVDDSGLVYIPAIDNTILVSAPGPVSVTGGSVGKP